VRNTESEVLRAIGKGRVEPKLGVPRSEEKSFDGIALGGGEGDGGESMMTVFHTIMSGHDKGL